MEENKNVELGIVYVTDQIELFDADSAVRRELISYGKLVQEMHVIVLIDRKTEKQIEKIGTNIFLYPSDREHAMQVVEKNCVWQGSLRANLIVATDPLLSGLVAMKIAKKYKKRLFVEYKRDFLKEAAGFSLKNYLKRNRIKHVVGRATRVLVSKTNYKNSIAPYLEKGDRQIAIVPTFINADSANYSPEKINFKEKYSGISFMMVMASDLERSQNIELGIDVAQKIINQYPLVGLLVLGDGPERASLQLRAHRGGFSRNIFFESMPNDLAPYLRSATVFLATGKTDDAHLAAVQALAIGTPALVTSTNSAASVLINTPYTKWICPIGDADCFKNNILEFIQHSGLRDDFRINGSYLLSGKLKSFGGDYVEAMVGEWRNAFK